MLTIRQRLALAVQHHEAGRLDEAEALYRGILQEAPQHPHALHLLGVVAHQAGRPQEAIDLIARALAAHGPHPVFFSNLAAACLGLGRPADAEAHCREALRLKPDFADAHANLGAALLKQGRRQEAASAFREARRLKPNPAAGPPDLDATPPRQGNLAEALARLRDIVRLNPANAQAQHDLGLVLLASGDAAQAVAYLREALRLRPDFAEAHYNLGVARQHLGEVDEAIRCLREALRLNPAHLEARNCLASALQAQGKIEEALAEFRETLRLDPANSQALFSLSELAASGYHRFRDEELEGLGRLAARDDLPAADLCRIHFALAQLGDRAGAHDEAFAHARRANELRSEIDRRCGVVFDPAAHRRFIDRLIATFTPEWFERVRSFGSNSELPVFVVGMMRSGTSLAEQILASHPRVHGAGELPDLDLLLAGWPRRLGESGTYPEGLACLDAAAKELAGAYLGRLRQLGGGAERVVDKLPFNFLHLGAIAALFPKARIVHCRRDPVDTCLSCFLTNFAGPFPFTRDLAHLGAYYREYERLMAHWSRVLPVPVFELRYEELTGDQEAVSRRLVEFCGLDWDDRCLRFHETRRAVWTASTLQVRRPMYRNSVGRWKPYEPHLGPLFKTLRGDAG